MKQFSNKAAVIVGEIVEYSPAHQTVSPKMQKSAEPLGIVHRGLRRQNRVGAHTRRSASAAPASLVQDNIFSDVP